MGIPDHLTCILRNPYAGQKADMQLEPDMEQLKIGKKYQSVYCHPASLAYMQSTS